MSSGRAATRGVLRVYSPRSGPCPNREGEGPGSPGREDVEEKHGFFGWRRDGGRAPASAGLRRAGLWLCLVAPLVLGACNPIYVARAGWSQAQILASRQPITEVMTDPDTEPDVQGKLRFVWDARKHAVEELGFRNAGDAYTTVAPLRSDTLALVVSAAYRDRLAFRTWWFPITGRVPYRAYFSTSSGERARDELEAEGYDTFLRPVAAFSTLGWFSDPIYSTLLRLDDVSLVETVLHELAHNHLFIPGKGRFNESYATFAGHAAAIDFFCTREGGGPDTVKCQRSRDRWADAQDVSRFLAPLEARIRELYAREDLELKKLLARRDDIYGEAQEEFRKRVQPGLRVTSYDQFAREPLNNATLLSRTLYFHRLPEFERLREEWDGSFAELMAWLREVAPRLDDPFDVLEPSNRIALEVDGSRP